MAYNDDSLLSVINHNQWQRNKEGTFTFSLGTWENNIGSNIWAGTAVI